MLIFKCHSLWRHHGDEQVVSVVYEKIVLQYVYIICVYMFLLKRRRPFRGHLFECYLFCLGY